MILSGKLVAEKIIDNARSNLSSISIVADRPPKLTILDVTSKGHMDNLVFERSVGELCGKLNIDLEIQSFSVDRANKYFLKFLKSYTESSNVDGILMIVPWKDANIERKDVLGILDPIRDIDGFGYLDLVSRKRYHMPSVVESVFKIIDYYKMSIFKNINENDRLCDILRGRKVAVMGRSLNVGLSIISAFTKTDVSLTVANKYSDLKYISDTNEILISATGTMDILNKENINSNNIIIDVGYNRNNMGVFVGDSNFNEIKDVVKAITPVPNGVGVVTTALIIEHLISSYNHNIRSGKI